MSIVILVAIICCCCCGQLTAAANQVVEASEYDDFLRRQQADLNQNICKNQEAKRIPKQTIYTKYQAECNTSYIPMRLQVLQTIRRESKYGVLEQKDIDDLHQEILHYLLLKNSQLLLNLIHREHYVSENVKDIKTFHKYLYEYYGELFVQEVYETTVDAFLRVWEDKPSASARLVDYLHIIYRRNIEGTYRTMALALLRLSEKLENVGAHHLRDTLYEISQNDLYYQMREHERQRIDRLTEQKLPIYNIKYWLDWLATKFQGGGAQAVESMKRLTTGNGNLTVMQGLLTEAMQKIWDFLYTNTDLNIQIDEKLKESIDEMFDKNTPIYSVEYWIDLILLKWKSAQIVESMDGIAIIYAQLQDNYPMSFVQAIFMGINQKIIDTGYYRLALDPRWVRKFLYLIYQPGNVKSFKLMVAAQIHSHITHNSLPYRTKLYDFYLGYYLRKITKDKFTAQLDNDAKRNLTEYVEALPRPIFDLFFHDILCLKNHAFPLSPLSNDSKSFIPAFYNNEDNKISLQSDKLASYFAVEVTLESSNRNEMYLNGDFGSVSVAARNGESFWTVAFVVGDDGKTYKALQFHRGDYYLCCVENKFNTNAPNPHCRFNQQLHPNYNIAECWWSIEAESKCEKM